MHKISIIVPIYNVEKHLDRCVASIVVQTYKNIEIILVNDGSTDNSPAICDDWAKKDNRIRVIHKENGGVSDARNVGVAAATGEYIGFVDSDDYIEPNMYEHLFCLVAENNADIALCSSDRIGENGEVLFTLNKEVEGVISSREAIERYANALVKAQYYYSTLWNRLIKKQLAVDIIFPKGKTYEDENTSCVFYDRCQKVVVSNTVLYHYVVRQGSIVSINNQMEKFDAFFCCYEYLKSRGYRQLLLSPIRRCYSTMLGSLKSVDYKQHKTLLKQKYRLIMPILIRHSLPRAVKLTLVYIKTKIKSR